jgi:hypothetical protein
VAHCDKPIDWIWKKYLKDDPWKSITIISKCGQPPTPSDLPPRTKVYDHLPNVGRCDHSYIWFIDNMAEVLHDYSPLHSQDHVIFMKDNDNGYRDWEETFTLQEMRAITERRKFACASAVISLNVFNPWEQPTNVAQKWTLGTFSMDTYAGARNKTSDDFVAPIRPLVNWATHLKQQNSIDIAFNTDLVPICFGGHFITTIERILVAPVANWTPALEALSRGDNIEEGHFMERLWAPLFSLPIPAKDQLILLKRMTRIFTPMTAPPYTGLLVLNKTADSESLLGYKIQYD